MPAPTAPLPLEEAVELAHAFAQHVADGAGIRILLIKGPVLSRHGLRPARVSSDVDVLVEPARLDEYCARLEAAGWRRRTGMATLTVEHSRAHVHDRWPCDIDAHAFFPGFLADPPDAFDALWERRTTLEFGHRACDAASRPAGVLIMALHALRGASRHERHVTELELAGRAELTAQERAELAALARLTGSTATAAEVLARLGAACTPDADELHSAAYREWRSLVDHRAHGATPWLRAFARAAGRDRPLIAWRAVWPSRRDLLTSTPGLTPRAGALLRARVVRLARGLRTLPAALAVLRAQRRAAH